MEKYAQQKNINVPQRDLLIVNVYAFHQLIRLKLCDQLTIQCQQQLANNNINRREDTCYI